MVIPENFAFTLVTVNDLMEKNFQEIAAWCSAKYIKFSNKLFKNNPVANSRYLFGNTDNCFYNNDKFEQFMLIASDSELYEEVTVDNIAGVLRYTNCGDGTIYINSIFVKKSFRNLGVAKVLLKKLEEFNPFSKVFFTSVFFQDVRSFKLFKESGFDSSNIGVFLVTSTSVENFLKQNKWNENSSYRAVVVNNSKLLDFYRNKLIHSKLDSTVLFGFTPAEITAFGDFLFKKSGTSLYSISINNGSNTKVYYVLGNMDKGIIEYIYDCLNPVVYCGIAQIFACKNVNNSCIINSHHAGLSECFIKKGFTPLSFGMVKLKK